MATGETSAMVLKMMAAMTSTKAALKFISVIFFITLSWFLTPQVFSYLNVPDESLPFMITTLGIGVGILIVELGSKFLSMRQETIETEQNEKLTLTEQAMEKAVQQANKEQFLLEFKGAYTYLQTNSKKQLWDCLSDDLFIGADDPSYTEVRGLNAIVLKTWVNYTKNVYVLNPILRPFIQEEYDKKLGQDVYRFTHELDSRKEEVLHVFLSSNKDSMVDYNIRTLLSNSSCLYGTFSILPTSLTLGIKEEYREHVGGFLEDHFGAEARDINFEVHLDSSRLRVSE